VGGPQTSSGNPQICGRNFLLSFADLPQMWQFEDLRFVYHTFCKFADLRLADPIIFADLKLPQIHIFFLTDIRDRVV
jgi:hypothetical protein